MRALRLLVLASLALAPNPSAAFPIQYAFTAVSFFNYQRAAYPNLTEFVRAHPDSAQTFTGTFSYDADSGIAALSFTAPILGTTPAFDLGGDLPAYSMLTTDLLSVQFGHPYTGYYLSDGLGGVVVRSTTATGLTLAGTGLLAGGALPQNLELVDLDEAYVWADVVYVDQPYSAYSLGCPAEFSLVECANAGYEQYFDGGQTVFAMTELHAIPVPEPALAALALLALGAALANKRAPEA